jgi:hypothetical protein
MSKHIESVVPCVPVRDADRLPASQPDELTPSMVQTTGPLIPVHQIPGLKPEERVEELRLRVRSGVYSHPAVVEQVARTMRARGL